MSESDDEQRERMERIAARKRYNMKSLGRLVDSNRLTGVARPVVPESELPHRSSRGENVEADGASVAVDDTDIDTDIDTGDAPIESQDDDVNGAGGHGTEAIEDSAAGAADVDVVERVAQADDAAPVRAAAVEPASDVGEQSGGGDGGASSAIVDEIPTGNDAVAKPRAEPKPVRRKSRPDRGDGVDRSGMGLQVTRSGLSARLGDRLFEPDAFDNESLARRMLDEEIQPGGHISDPREVPGIVLDLAKDIPAAVAVSVVRVDEEVELIGNTVDPEFESEWFSQLFSGLFRSLQSVSGVFRDGPFGQVHDVVIEGDSLDLVLRPLGEDYYLMVLEDRTNSEADLAATRSRLAVLAPGLTAILAHRDGEV